MTRLISERVGYRGSACVKRDVAEAPIKTQGEIESAICEFICRLQQEYMGRGPKNIRVYLIDDLLVVRLLGVLTAPNSIWSSRSRPRKGGICSSKYGSI